MIQTFMGLVTSYEGLLAARFFLGVAEAGLFPGKSSIPSSAPLRFEALVSVYLTSPRCQLLPLMLVQGL